MKHFWIGLVFSGLLGACATTSSKLPHTVSTVTVPPSDEQSVGDEYTLPASEGKDQDSAVTDEDMIRVYPSAPSAFTPDYGLGNAAFSALPDWERADVKPALTAFLKNCQLWETKNPENYLSTERPDLGRISDWLAGCEAAKVVEPTPAAARKFFEGFFYPLDNMEGTGLITGYYQPEIFVRSMPTDVYSEPILSLPYDEEDQNLPRSKVKKYTSDIIAYGKPLEVFFMQVQGSGILTFENGRRLRASYAGNNGHDYTSIGAVLVRRGHMTLEQASKQSIENWMNEAGPKAARALMNENKRYIFFRAEKIVPEEGPRGAMSVSLTAMGSLAVDPAHHPYGLPIWLNVKLPQEAGDYKGQETGQLVIAQDTGKAIRGAYRGDLYFGTGEEAGARAGVMKHKGQWTILIPQALIRSALIS